jgi:hypothetical protein
LIHIYPYYCDGGTLDEGLALQLTGAISYKYALAKFDVKLTKTRALKTN